MRSCHICACYSPWESSHLSAVDFICLSPIDCFFLNLSRLPSGLCHHPWSQLASHFSRKTEKQLLYCITSRSDQTRAQVSWPSLNAYRAVLSFSIGLCIHSAGHTFSLHACSVFVHRRQSLGYCSPDLPFASRESPFLWHHSEGTKSGSDMWASLLPAGMLVLSTSTEEFN